MPWREVMHKFKHGTLRSGGKGEGHPVVTDPEQAVAIMLSEKRKNRHPRRTARDGAEALLARRR